jgi:hypothetical protein
MYSVLIFAFTVATTSGGLPIAGEEDVETTNSGSTVQFLLS